MSQKQLKKKRKSNVSRLDNKLLYQLKHKLDYLFENAQDISTDDFFVLYIHMKEMKRRGLRVCNLTSFTSYVDKIRYEYKNGEIYDFVTDDNCDVKKLSESVIKVA